MSVQGARPTANFSVSDRLFKKYRQWASDEVKGNYVDEDVKSKQ